MRGLGGLRHALKNSPNTGLRNASFRGFADYMQTDEFQESIEKLIDAAEEETTVVMCAEAVPRRCHRSLISDALSVRRLHIKHIISAGSSKDHTLTPWAKVSGNKIIYPSELGTQQITKIKEVLPKNAILFLHCDHTQDRTNTDGIKTVPVFL